MIDYEKVITNENNLYEAVLKSVKNSKWKTSSQRTIVDILRFVCRLSDTLKNKTYKSNVVSTFKTYERGRLRLIDSYSVNDRAVRHVLCDEIFSDKIKNKIIYDNSASIKGRGLSYARRRFEVHLHKYYNKFKTNEGYILFGDFSKFYDNIIHTFAKEQLLELVDNDPYISWLLDVIFEAFEVDCSHLTNDEIDKLYYGVLDKLSFNFNNHNYKTKKMLKKSISIGDQLSQLIGIYYPHEIDNYVKIVRSQKYYGRYADDWYIISNSKDELLDILKNIEKIATKLGIHVNKRKTRIVKLSSNYKYLQVIYSLTETGRVIKKINPKRVTTMRIKLKKLALKVENSEIPYEYVENSFKSWMGSFYKLMSKDQRKNMIELYESLFNADIEIKNSKMKIYRKELL